MPTTRIAASTGALIDFASSMIGLMMFVSLKGLIPPDGQPLMIAMVMAASIVLFTSGVIEMVNGELILGTVALFFSCFFTFAQGLVMLLPLTVSNISPVAMSVVGGWLMIFAGVVLLLITFTFMFIGSFPTLNLIFADIAVLALGLLNIGAIGQWVAEVSAWAFLLFGISAVYLGVAMLNNMFLQRMMFPIGGPLIILKPVQHPSGSAKEAL